MGKQHKQHPRAFALHTHCATSTPFGSRTDVGCVREHNEDSLVAAAPLFAIADGMGGHAAGEVASEIAINTLVQNAPKHPDGEALACAVKEANLEVIRASHDGRGRRGMGTTMTAAVLQHERVVIAQVGDSRAYLLHQGNLQQITRDHSLMADMIEAGQITPEEARVHPKRSVITRALGSDACMQPDIYELDVEAGDRLLLCSDGLPTMVRDKLIEEVMSNTPDAQRCATKLVDEAIFAGGHDNITVIVVDVTAFREVQQKKTTRKTRCLVSLIIIALILLVGGAVWATGAYLNKAAYLADDNGKVAIYRGVPDTVLGFSLSRYERTTDVITADLQPGTAHRLAVGIRVDSVEAAEKLVAEYKEEAESRADKPVPSAQSEHAEAEGIPKERKSL